MIKLDNNVAHTEWKLYYVYTCGANHGIKTVLFHVKCDDLLSPGQYTRRLVLVYNLRSQFCTRMRNVIFDFDLASKELYASLIEAKNPNANNLFILYFSASAYIV